MVYIIILQLTYGDSYFSMFVYILCILIDICVVNANIFK